MRRWGVTQRGTVLVAEVRICGAAARAAAGVTHKRSAAPMPRAPHAAALPGARTVSVAMETPNLCWIAAGRLGPPRQVSQTHPP